MKSISTNDRILLGLIAYKYGEISEEKCVEITGMRRDKIREEMTLRCGAARPLDEAFGSAEEANRRIAMLSKAVNSCCIRDMAYGWDCKLCDAEPAADPREFVHTEKCPSRIGPVML